MTSDPGTAPAATTASPTTGGDRDPACWLSGRFPG